MEEAIVLLNQHGPKVKVIAGGTDLIPQMKRGELKPTYVLSLSQIEALRKISLPRGWSEVGRCTIAEIEKSPVIREHYPVLAQAASVLGSIEIRNRGTVVKPVQCSAVRRYGAFTSGFGCQAAIASSKGERVLWRTFVGPGKTVLEAHEILARLEIPAMKPRSAGEYIKLGIRKAMDIAVAGVAAILSLDSGDGVCAEARLALGAVAPTPMRAGRAESYWQVRE
jgi:carbon-monoxide dehydrogenase medium subunit